MRPAGMLIDLDRCIGCHTCTVACQMENRLSPGLVLIPVSTLSGTPDVPQGSFPDLTLDYIPKPCAHCDDPPCASSCPADAISQRDDGLVVIDGALCTACGDCATACPYGAIVLDGDGRAHKCDLCASRQEQDLEPFCVVCCPTRALIIGQWADVRDGLVPSAHLGTKPRLRYRTKNARRSERLIKSLGW